VGLIFLTLVVSVEGFWRSRGHHPSVVDSPDYWGLHRARVQDRSDQVVLIGGSRMQLGFDSDTFHRMFPSRPITRLEINGTSPMGSLRNLADDPKFCGTVICSCTALSFLSEQWNAQQEYLQSYRELNPLNQFEPWIRSRLQHRLVILNPNVSSGLVTDVFQGKLPEPLNRTTRLDRSQPTNFASVRESAKRTVLRRIKNRDYNIDDEQWLADVRVVGEWVERIKARGGQVVFVRFPTTDEHWQFFEQLTPREVFWDRLPELTGAPCVHFRDYATLSRFDCPDTSHLDCTDAPGFTRELIKILQTRNLL